MGTRADFYIGRGSDAEWLGSIAFDGYFDDIPAPVRRAVRPAAFRKALTAFFAVRDDVTLPKDGWPWPWEDSSTTDYAYAFDAGKVYASRFGGAWRSVRGKRPEEWPEHPKVEFPNMKSRQCVTLGKRSGLFVIDLQGVKKNLR